MHNNGGLPLLCSFYSCPFIFQPFRLIFQPFPLTQGARWDASRKCLRSSQPGVLHQPMPVLLVWPTTVADAAQRATTAYRCPVYVNSQRANVYSPMVATFTLEVGPPGGGAEGASDTAVVRASARAATLCSIGKANIERN